MLLKGLVIAAVTAVWLYRMMLTAVRLRSANNPVPENVADVYDADTYRKWRAYHSEKARLELAEQTVSFIVDLALLSLNVYAAFAGLFPKQTVTQLFAVLLLSSLTDIFLLPFSWHETMVIEEKYGFNRTNARTFWLDKVKEFVIGLGLITGVGALLAWLHEALGDWLILAFTGFLTLFALFTAFMYPILSGIFNKFTPLEDGELKEKLTALLSRHGYRVRGIKVMDASRRTSKANAYFSGFGKMKTIVLYDTLIQTMTPDEICAVFAHELGHGLHRDTLRNQVFSILQTALLAVLAWLTLRSEALFAAFGFDGVNYGFAIILITSAEFALISPLFGLLTSHFSRRAEYRADAQAVKEGYGKEQVSALKKLARRNFADLAPSPLLVRLTYTHPPLSQRIGAIEKAMADK